MSAGPAGYGPASFHDCFFISGWPRTVAFPRAFIFDVVFVEVRWSISGQPQAITSFVFYFRSAPVWSLLGILNPALRFLALCRIRTIVLLFHYSKFSYLRFWGLAVSECWQVWKRSHLEVSEILEDRGFEVLEIELLWRSWSSSVQAITSSEILNCVAVPAPPKPKFQFIV